MSWVKPVFDRIEQDVAQKVPRGLVNAADMNRIGGNTMYLAGLLGQQSNAKTGYVPGGFLHEQDMRQLAGSLEGLYRSWPEIWPADKGSTWYSQPLPTGSPNHWQQFNTLENIHHRMKQIAEPVYCHAYCGEGYTGEF